MSKPIERVEIITGRERRRRYIAEEKVGLVEETMQPGMTVSAVARLHGVSPSLLFGWRRRMAEGGLEAVRADEDVVAASRVRELAALGQMEVEIIRERTRAGLVAAASRGRVGGRPPALDEAKVHAARAMLASGTMTASGVARQLGCGPSTLYRHLPGGRSALDGAAA
jgi:transposase